MSGILTHLGAAEHAAPLRPVQGADGQRDAADHDPTHYFFTSSEHFECQLSAGL